MQQYLYLITAASLCAGLLNSAADVIFSQDFSAGPPISQYVGSPPNDHQFDTINWSGGTGGIVNNALQFTHNGTSSSWFARTTPFSPTPSAVIYSFDLSVSDNIQAQPTTAVWQVGSGFHTSSGAEQTSLVHSRIGIGFNASAGSYNLLDMNGNSVSESGNKAITWVINNSGVDLTYLGPDNKSYTLADDSYDLWADNSEVFHNVHSSAPTRPLSNIKFTFDGGYGTIRMDNINVRTVQPVPEPTATGLIAIGFLALVLGGA
jgi:hypothetical protein